VTIGFGPPNLTIALNGKRAAAPADVASVLQRIPPRFVVDETNKLRERADTNLNPRLPSDLREAVGDFITQICNGYESAEFVIPNRKVAPHESWQVKMPMLLKTGRQAEVIDLAMTCTFEGVRAAAENPQALVSFTGTLHSRVPGKDHLDGTVAGRFTFDIQHGFVSSSKMAISSQASSASDDTEVVLAFDVDLTRVAGDTRGIALPASASAPPEVALQRPVHLPQSSSVGRNATTGVFPFKGVFPKPDASSTPTSYMKVVSTPGEYVGQGKTYEYTGDQFKATVTKRGIAIRVDGWRFEAGAPVGKFLTVGEYPDAKRFPFSGTSPGLEFSGKGRANNKLTGAFAVWELEIENNQIVKLAIDFEQRTAPEKPPVTGKIRFNSSLK
jgi:hypothetical protein